ncbi:MAG: carboxyl transferase [Deltaproteobacteria bacterium]|jgi:methylmalonyl-CoA decarboxylase subunit alpha|nr:carboxyl transferase [Deltaproteobacteria bacterium]MBT4266764.1 carboxyl transferase [Deltaproteobacteria bacterium]MBT4643728.1 carboxyl transferase [Deltaproteobacteria bacterium]MBT6503286.1 carboxyl transferase [Deltaproteobacteria bacterium]MBT7151972.1 carboxyl transferase [Deltaproteobacteria bacterium]
MGLGPKIDELKRRKAKALEMGGKRKVDAQHKKGFFTARERIEKLLDPDSFFEIGLLNHSDVRGMEDKTPADGKIDGFGTIDDRTVGVSANDVTVMAGAGGRIGHQKASHLIRMAVEKGYPIVNLGEAGGARIPDIQGSDGMSSMTTTNQMTTRLRRIPMVATIMGDCLGDPSWMAALADFVVQVKGSCMAVSGPRVLEVATSEKVSAEELGGWKLHAKTTGQVDRAAEDEEDCFRIVREYLSYMPSNSDELPPIVPCTEDASARQNQLLDLIPDQSNKSYDMKRLIKTLVDNQTIFEIKPKFDASVITCLARIDGQSVGIIANQPSQMAGAMGPEGCDKCISFICLCDSFNIPLIFLHDTPGFRVGKAAEKKRMPGRIITFIQALSSVTVPLISIVIRKSYGMANCNMCGANMGADFYFAWPSADISFMGPEVATNVVYGAKIAASENPEEMWNQAVAELKLASEPWRAAGLGYLDDVIQPQDTREIIIKSIKLARGKNKGFSKRMLANWPTAY